MCVASRVTGGSDPSAVREDGYEECARSAVLAAAASRGTEHHVQLRVSVSVFCHIVLIRTVVMLCDIFGFFFLAVDVVVRLDGDYIQRGEEVLEPLAHGWPGHQQRASHLCQCLPLICISLSLYTHTCSLSFSRSELSLSLTYNVYTHIHTYTLSLLHLSIWWMT